MHLRKTSFHRTDSSSSWTHKSDSLPNFGVNRHVFVRVSIPNGARPPLPINIKGHDRLSIIQSIKHNVLFIVLPLLLFLRPSSSNLDLLFFLRLRDDRRRSRWPADPRATLRASTPTGSLPSRRL
jgi:hypothetical protein